MIRIDVGKKCLIMLLLAISLRIQGQQKIEVQTLSKENIFTLAPFKQCHASSLIELGKNTLMSAWFGGSYEGAKDVCIWASINKKGKWNAQICLVCGVSEYLLIMNENPRARTMY